MVVTHLKDALNITLFEISGTPVSVATLFSVGLIILVTLAASHIARRTVKRAFKYRGVQDEGSSRAVARLLHYAALLIGFSIAIQTLGINLSALFAAGAIFAVGIGFAMQSIAQNFVSGVILLVERSIKPGDVVSIEGVIARVTKMGIRATIVETRDGENMIVPNSALIQSTVKNYTLGNPDYRVRISVGVAYDSNMDLVQSTLESVVDHMQSNWKLQGRQPFVMMKEFGDNSVNFEMGIWIDGPWTWRPVISDLHHAVWDALKEQGITIAFPQLDVHFDAPVTQALSKQGPLKQA